MGWPRPMAKVYGGYVKVPYIIGCKTLSAEQSPSLNLKAAIEEKRFSR